mmetsp:Transcript_999/g.1561  ORF Transcript_999/g.1561 Transcript_999/m.1561 type:complete len:204 (-) Transcript_999:132-743(-)
MMMSMDRLLAFFYLFASLFCMSRAVQPSVTHMEALHVSHEDLPWADFGGGIFIKFPVADPTTGMYTVVLKSEGGGKVNRHRHFGSVYAITLEGAWYYKEHDFLAKKGDFVWETPGSVHTLMTSDDYEENLVFFIVYGALEFLDDEDNTIVMFDWMAAANTQYAACEEAGISCPDLTRPRGTKASAAGEGDAKGEEANISQSDL